MLPQISHGSNVVVMALSTSPLMFIWSCLLWSLRIQIFPFLLLMHRHWTTNIIFLPAVMFGKLIIWIKSLFDEIKASILLYWSEITVLVLTFSVALSIGKIGLQIAWQSEKQLSHTKLSCWQLDSIKNWYILKIWGLALSQVSLLYEVLKVVFEI